MAWNLDRGFFRSLAGFYALSLGLSVAAGLFETLAPSWQRFSDDFHALTDQHFGTPNEPLLSVALVVWLIALAWHFGAIWGLRNFRPWSRWNFWVSEILFVVSLFLPSLTSPTYLGPLGNLTESVRLGLFAVILLLLYSQDHGVEWFKTPLETLKETF